MAMTIPGMSSAIKNAVISFSTVSPRNEDLEPFCNALATAIVNYFKSNADITVPVNAISTQGGATNQVGPAVPIILKIS